MLPPPSPQHPTQQRLGPRPLILHLWYLGLLSSSWPLALTSWNNACETWNRQWPNNNPDDLQKIVPEQLPQKLSEISGHFAEAVLKYRRFPYQRSDSPHQIIWQDGSTIIRHYPSQKPAGQPIILLPSLVNRAYIFDLDSHQSFVHFLTAQGCSVYVIDWQAPDNQEMQFTLDDYLLKRLVPAVYWLSLQLGQSLPVLGYCMGGTLAVALAVLAPQLIHRLILLAAPWDFHAGYDHNLRQLLQINHPFLTQLINENGYLPVDILQSMFASLQPYLTIRKFCSFHGLSDHDPRSKSFVVLEDWLNDGVHLAGPVAKTCLFNWYLDNQLAKKQWFIGQKAIDPALITCPTLIVAAENDYIVPTESSLSLTTLIPQSEQQIMPFGHIGLMASRNAQQQVWPQLYHWLTGP